MTFHIINFESVLSSLSLYQAIVASSVVKWLECGMWHVVQMSMKDGSSTLDWGKRFFYGFFSREIEVYNTPGAVFVCCHMNVGIRSTSKQS